ncbi:kelch-like protein diablo isoform X1 [Alosa alosa]|uniref:kelch-like protein diablo isoform X1 n=1 Tax=Alosa alosa TaxID=278164 RepID=UPI0020152F4A|nr:kelch-like protein diablo isoform X1 [Alosa alosa]
MGVYTQHGETLDSTTLNRSLEPQGSAIPASQNNRKAKPSQSDVVYVVGGWSKDDPLCPVEQFCTEYNEWKTTTPIMRHRRDAGVCAVGRFIYMVGGADEITCISSMERYDPGQTVWNGELPSISSPRSRVCVCEMDGCLVCIGGFDGHMYLNSVERYDSSRNAWSKLAPLQHKRAGATAVVMNGQLYVIGGTDGNTILDSVERFDPAEGCWALCPPLRTPREGAGSTVFLGRIYVAGGRDDLGLPLKTAEKYDSESFRWTPVKPMNNKRYQVSLLVFNDLLLAVGGSDGVSNHKTMEAYEHENNCWRHFGSMKSKHPGGHVAVLKAS